MNKELVFLEPSRKVMDMKYLVLCFRTDDDLNPDIYWTDDYADGTRVGEGAEYHSYTIVTAAKSEYYVNEEDE